MTARQSQVEQFVREYHQTRGYGPSIAEVARWCGVSTVATRKRIACLKRAGRLVSDDGVPRSLRVPKREPTTRGAVVG